MFVPNPSGRVDQADQAQQQAAALHAAGVHHAGALHPNFIEPLVKGLSPTLEEIAWAHKAITEFDRLTVDGESVGMLDGKVVDKYENDLAIRTLDWAAACAAKDAYKVRAMQRAQVVS